MIRVVILSFSLWLAGSASADTGGTLHHIVLVWLKADTPAALVDELMEKTRGLAAIETVRDLHVGRAVPSERPIVDDSFSFGITFTFSNREDMQRYLVHPLHINYVEKLLKPHLEKVIVYDY